ncbi:MAG: hypothetical protein GTO03_00035 [Planctomycetales bacterium]|nr:hypothetical protein [Planctomycetales bacterium]
MKRMILALAFMVSVLLVTVQHADAGRKVRRWLGIHYGPGIHAYNACPPCGCRHRHAAHQAPTSRHANLGPHSWK